MSDRIKAAVDGERMKVFLLARTDSYASEGMEGQLTDV